MIIPISIDLKDTITDSNHNPLGMRTDRLTKEPIVSCGDADAPPQSTCQTSAVRCPPFFSTSFFILMAIIVVIKPVIKYSRYYFHNMIDCKKNNY